MELLTRVDHHHHHHHHHLPHKATPHHPVNPTHNPNNILLQLPHHHPHKPTMHQLPNNNLNLSHSHNTLLQLLSHNHSHNNNNNNPHTLLLHKHQLDPMPLNHKPPSSTNTSMSMWLQMRHQKNGHPVHTDHPHHQRSITKFCSSRPQLLPPQKPKTFLNYPLNPRPKPLSTSCSRNQKQVNNNSSSPLSPQQSHPNQRYTLSGTSHPTRPHWLQSMDHPEVPLDNPDQLHPALDQPHLLLLLVFMVNPTKFLVHHSPNNIFPFHFSPFQVFSKLYSTFIFIFINIQKTRIKLSFHLLL